MCPCQIRTWGERRRNAWARGSTDERRAVYRFSLSSVPIIAVG